MLNTQDFQFICDFLKKKCTIVIESGKEYFAVSVSAFPEDEMKKPENTIDAISEFVNIIAGGVKRRLNDISGGIHIGLPVFLNGVFQTGSGQDLQSLKINLGKVPVHILVVKSRV